MTLWRERGLCPAAGVRRSGWMGLPGRSYDTPRRPVPRTVPLQRRRRGLRPIIIIEDGRNRPAAGGGPMGGSS